MPHRLRNWIELLYLHIFAACHSENMCVFAQMLHKWHAAMEELKEMRLGCNARTGLSRNGHSMLAETILWLAGNNPCSNNCQLIGSATWHIRCRCVRDLRQRLAPAHAAQQELTATSVLKKSSRVNELKKTNFWQALKDLKGISKHLKSANISPPFQHCDAAVAQSPRNIPHTWDIRYVECVDCPHLHLKPNIQLIYPPLIKHGSWRFLVNGSSNFS